MLIDQYHIDIIKVDPGIAWTDEDQGDLEEALEIHRVCSFIRTLLPSHLLKKVQIDVSK